MKCAGTANIQIRLATNADVESIKNVVFPILNEYGLVADEFGEDKDLMNIEKYYTKNNGYFFVMVNQTDNSVIGTVGILRIDNSICQLRKLYLLKEYRRMGLGKMLLEHSIECAKINNYTKIILETISPLKAAIALYEKHGFKKIPTIHITDRVDQTYMLVLDANSEAVDEQNKEVL
jgi:putative acetyltransferase